MAQVEEPECGMTIDSATIGNSDHQGTRDCFRSTDCKVEIDKNQKQFASEA